MNMLDNEWRDERVTRGMRRGHAAQLSRVRWQRIAINEAEENLKKKPRAPKRAQENANIAPGCNPVCNRRKNTRIDVHHGIRARGDRPMSEISLGGRISFPWGFLACGVHSNNVVLDHICSLLVDVALMVDSEIRKPVGARGAAFDFPSITRTPASSHDS